MSEPVAFVALLFLSLLLYGLVYVYIRVEINALHDEVIRMYKEVKSDIEEQRTEIALLRYRIRRIKAPYQEDLK